MCQKRMREEGKVLKKGESVATGFATSNSLMS